MIKAVIFDLDNTLLDFMRLKRVSCEEAMDAMIDAGLSIEKEKALKLLFKLYDKYGIEHKEIFQKFLRETTGGIDYKILANGIVAYRRIKNGFLTTYPGVRATLIGLRERGIKLAILSDAPRMRAWTRLAALQLTEYFDAVVTYEDTGKRKPHPLPFRRVLSRLGLPAESVLMVGDWPERDIKGAKKMGIRTCFARYGAQNPDMKVSSDYVLSSVRELLAIVDKENGDAGEG